MVHKDRIFAITEVETLEKLAGMVTEYTWTLCSGFKCGNVILLNDSFSENGCQEYVLVLETPEGLIEAESITVSWCSPERLVEIIEETIKNPFSRKPFDPNRLDFTKQHRCYLCC